MSKTIKNLMLELEELEQRHVIWEEVKSFLDGKTRAEKGRGLMMPDGRAVDQDVVLNMLAEIDETVDDIMKRIKQVEGMEVNLGRGKSAKATGRTRKKG